LDRTLLLGELWRGRFAGRSGCGAFEGDFLDESDFHRLGKNRLPGGSGKTSGEDGNEERVPRNRSPESLCLRPVHQLRSPETLTSATLRRPALLISPITRITRP
jgi:hypothetical protein